MSTIGAEAAVSSESPRDELTTPVSVCLSVSLGGGPLQVVDTPQAPRLHCSFPQLSQGWRGYPSSPSLLPQTRGP